MPPQDHSELRITVPVAPTEAQKSFTWHARVAAKLAMDHFDARIKREVAAESPQAKGIRDLLRREYDWNDIEFSVKDSIDELMADKALYLSVVEHIHDLDTLYQAMETIANVQIEELVFDMNDYPRASLRRDQFVHCLGTIIDTLRDEGMLSPEDRRFDDLINGYQCALSGYLEMREHIFDHTKGRHSSLMEWTATSAIEKNRTAEEPNEEKAGRLMMRRYRAMFKEWGLDVGKKGLLPIAYAHIGALVMKVAMRESMNAHPHERDPAILSEKAKPYVKKHLETIAQMGTNLTSLAQVTQAENYVLDAYAKAFRQPRDFHILVGAQAKIAEERARAALPRLKREAQNDQSSLKTRGEAKLLEEGVDPYHHGMVETLASHWFSGIKDELEKAENIEKIVQLFEEDADAVLHETTCGLEHPAMILLRRDYTEAFGKALLEELKQRNQDLPEGQPPYAVRGMKDVFDALISKYDEAYHGHWETANWCLRQTDNAYADFGQYVLALQMAAKGKTYDQMTQEERLEVPVIARQYITQAGVDRGIPEAWASHPLMPRLYRLALDHAASKVNRELQSNPLFPNDRNPTRPFNEAEMGHIVHTQQAAEEEISGLSGQVLRGAVGMFPSDPPNAYGILPQKREPLDLYVPYIDAATLQKMIEFFEANRTKSRAH